MKPLNNNKGFVSILVTILCLIGVVIISYLIDSNTQSLVIREVEGMMDASGKNTLNQVVNVKKLKQEVFGLFEDGEEIKKDDPDGVCPLSPTTKSKIETIYKSELASQVSTNSIILEAETEKINIEFGKSSWGGGVSSKSRPYIFLDTVVKLRIKHAQAFDYSESYHNRTFKAVKSGNTDITVENLGSPQNGEMIMVIRSVTRMFYR